MVFISCFACGAYCDHNCYFTHSTTSACHDPRCRNFYGRRRFDRLYYNSSWQPWVSLSHDGITEYNISARHCTGDMLIQQLSEELDGTLAVKMMRPGTMTSVMYLEPTRRVRRRQPTVDTLPMGWTYTRHHYHLED